MIDNIDVSVPKGPFSAALVKAYTVGGMFEWLIDDTLDSVAFTKPVWHKGDCAFVDGIGAEVFISSLPSPTFSEDSGEVSSGTTVTITCPSGCTLYYKVNGSSYTATSNVTLTIDANTYVSAFLVNNNAASEIESRTYTVADSGITLTASDATTVTLGSDTYNLVAGENVLSFSTLGGRTFASIAFGDKTKITKADFGGATITSLAQAFKGATALTECVNLNVNGSCVETFSGCSALTKAQVSGNTTNMNQMFYSCTALTNLDLSELSGSVTSLSSAFQATNRFTGTIDLSGIDTSSCESFSGAFRLTKAVKVIIGDFSSEGLTGQYAIINMFNSTSTIKTLECTSNTPPMINGSYNWLSALATACSWQSSAKPIKVPVGALSAYQSATYWSDYANYMEEIS